MDGSSHLIKRYLVILADRRRGRYFTTYLGNFEGGEEATFDKEVPQRVKAEHTRPGKVQAHIRDHLHKHLKQVGKSALDFLIKNRIRQIDGVIIGSHQELLHQIKKFLPTRLKKKVISEFVTDLKVPTGQLVEKIGLLV